MTGEKTGERILAAVALSVGTGAFLLCLESPEGWSFEPVYPLLCGTALVFLNAFLFRKKKRLRLALFLAEGALILLGALLLLFRGGTDWTALLRAAGGSAAVREERVPALLAAVLAWTESAAVFFLFRPGIAALVFSALWLLFPMLGVRPGLPLFLLFVFSVWLLLRRKERRGTASLLLLAAFLLAVPAGYLLTGPASDALYRVENAVYSLRKGSSDGAGAIGGTVSEGSALRTGREVMEVSLSRRPEETLYLKCFTGITYRNGAWRAEDPQETAELVRKRVSWGGWQDFLDSMTVSKYYVLNTVTYGALVMNGSPSVYPVEMEITFPGRNGPSFEPYYGKVSDPLPEDAENGGKVRRYEYYETKDMLFRWDEVPDAVIGSWYRSLESAHRAVIRDTCMKVSMNDLPRLRKLTLEYPASNREEAAARILRILSDRTEYALNPGQGSLGSDPVEEFLFVKKRGFCEHYASAATLLFRLYGIPARYAAGYRIGPEEFREDEDGRYRAEVSDLEAHAWVELYLEDYGWTPLEVTPASDGGIVPVTQAFDGETINGLIRRDEEEEAEDEAAEKETEGSEGTAFRDIGSEEEIDTLRLDIRELLEKAPWSLILPMLFYAALWAAVLRLRRRGRLVSGEGDAKMEKIDKVIREVRKVVLGKDREIGQIMTAILAGGHILLEDVPGVGKTTTAVAFARAMQIDMKRVQFTPDVMPSDLTGFSLYRREEERFVYQPGAVFTNLLLADELNRTSPKTQSALLEVMEEKHVTVDGVTREVPDPFIVIASENPAGATGTEPLPETQLDRFMISLSLGYPDADSEREIALTAGEKRRETLAEPVITGDELRAMRSAVQNVVLDERTAETIVGLVAATRKHPMVSRGASPRATVALAMMAKAAAYEKGKKSVTEEEVTEEFPYVVRHRIELLPSARRAGVTPDEVVREILSGRKDRK